MAAGWGEFCAKSAQSCSGHTRAGVIAADRYLVCRGGDAPCNWLVVFRAWMAGRLILDCQSAIETRLVGGDAGHCVCGGTLFDWEVSVVGKIENPETVSISAKPPHV